MDKPLSDWIEAYGRLKAAQTSAKAAGPRTLTMRQDLARLQLSAESALKHLQAGVDPVTSRAPIQPPDDVKGDSRGA